MLYSACKNSFYIDAVHVNIPVDAIEVTPEQWEAFGLGQPPAGYRRGADENGRPTWVPIPLVSLDDLAASKRAELDRARDAAFDAGLPYEIAGEPDVVQTRPQGQINLLGLNAKATRLISSGNAETLMEFRGLSNVSHWIDAEAMDDMTMAALSHIEDIYQQSWERKDLLDAAFEAKNREAIEKISW